MRLLFDVRWAFHYEPKGPVYGLWSHQGHDERNQFSKQEINGRKRVELEYRNKKDRIIRTYASIPAEMFVTFEWLATAIVPLGVEMSIQPVIVGLRLKSKTHSYTFMVDGSHEIKEF